MKTPAAIEPSAEKAMVLHKWAARLRNGAPDWQLQAAGADLLDSAASAIEGLQRENRALFDGYQGCIADRTRLAQENAALRSGRSARGERDDGAAHFLVLVLKIVTGLLLIAFGCGLIVAGVVRVIGWCG